MDRQQLLDNFVTACNGKGRAMQLKRLHGISSAGCVYIKNGHPGCAIGCQPGFREKFGEKEWVIENCGIGSVLDGWLDNRTPPEDADGVDVSEFFGIENVEDVKFLSDLQDFHDLVRHWDGTKIVQYKLASFCLNWSLKRPQVCS